MFESILEVSQNSPEVFGAKHSSQKIVFYIVLWIIEANAQQP